MLSSLDQFVTNLWVSIFVLWGITSLASRRTVASRSGWRARAAVWVVGFAWFLLFNHKLRPGPLAWQFVPMSQAVLVAGLILTTAGLAFSIWARVYIGRNWSALITVKEDHQLISTGPYAIVRHPIYAGFMVATLGTAILFGELGGLVSVALVLLAWGYKSRLEEALMIERFGPEYERYRLRVKGLIPLVW